MAVDAVTRGHRWRVRHPWRTRRALLPVILVAAGALQASEGFTEGEILSNGCGGCHGHTGVSAASSMPSIAGFDRRYTARLLREFKDGSRYSTIMGRVMAGYTLPQINLLASYYADQTWEGSAFRADPAKVEPGRRIHEALCEQCHEDSGRYQDRDMPRVAGQQPEYLRIQMQLRRAGTEGMQQPNRMRDALLSLSDAEVLAMTHYLASRD